MRDGLLLVDEQYRTMLVDEQSRVSCSLTSSHVTGPVGRFQGMPEVWLVVTYATPLLCMRIVTLSLLLPGFVLKPRDLISELHIIRCPRIW